MPTQRERASGLNAIVHDVITKPFSVADIRTAVADALAARKDGPSGGDAPPVIAGLDAGETILFDCVSPELDCGSSLERRITRVRASDGCS